jgi:hypothetical protein
LSHWLTNCVPRSTKAEAYALVQVLIETGRISSSQWAKAFGAALREAAGQGEPDSSDTYYAALSETLQRVLVAGGRVQDAEIRQRDPAFSASAIA